MNAVYFALLVAAYFFVGLVNQVFGLIPHNLAEFYDPVNNTIMRCPIILEGESATTFCQIEAGWDNVSGSSNWIFTGLNFARFILTDFLPVIADIALWNYGIFDYWFMPYIQWFLRIIFIIAFAFGVVARLFLRR